MINGRVTDRKIPIWVATPGESPTERPRSTQPPLLNPKCWSLGSSLRLLPRTKPPLFFTCPKVRLRRIGMCWSHHRLSMYRKMGEKWEKTTNRTSPGLLLTQQTFPPRLKAGIHSDAAWPKKNHRTSGCELALGFNFQLSSLCLWGFATNKLDFRWFNIIFQQQKWWLNRIQNRGIPMEFFGLFWWNNQW